MAIQLFVGSLPFDASSQSLVRVLWDYVVPEQAAVIMDRDSGRSKGFAFVTVATPEDAVMACRADGQRLDGRSLTLNVAAPMPARAPRPRLPDGRDGRSSSGLLRASDQHVTVDIPGTEFSADVFQQELLAALDVAELNGPWVEESLSQMGLVKLSTRDESLRHQLCRLIEALAARPTRLPDLHPRLFEYVVGALLAASGYQNVTVTGPSADGGIDILASKNAGLGRSQFLVQCKRYAPHNKVDRPAVQLTYGVSAAYGATKAALVTTSSFTKPASDFIADNENRIAGFDGRDLEVWLKATSLLVTEPNGSRGGAMHGVFESAAYRY